MREIRNSVGRLLLLALVVAAAMLTPHAALAVPVFLGTTATYNLTKSSDVPTIWRKVQGKVETGFNFMCEEWEYLEELQDYEVDWTTREILVPIDISESYGASSIAEGAYETVPSTPAPQELSLGFIMLNKRFTISKLTRYIDEKSRSAQIKRQLIYQGKKAVEAIARTFADYHWGYSTGYLAQTSTATTSAGPTAYTLKNLYGSSTVSGGTTAEKNALVARFKVGDRVALIRSAALVTNAIGTVSVVTAATPSITITWLGSVTSVDGDYIVLANSMENTTISGTDYNLGLVGYMDGMLSTTVHGLAVGTAANWTPANSDTSGGRMSGTKLRKDRDEIANKCGVGKADTCWLSQGVNRDLIALQAAALRFADPWAMEIDGDIKSKGFTFRTGRRVPPGYSFVGVQKTLRKGNLLSKPSENVQWSDAKERPDQSGYVVSMDFPCFLVWTNRAAWAYRSGLTEQ